LVHSAGLIGLEKFKHCQVLVKRLLENFRDRVKTETIAVAAESQEESDANGILGIPSAKVCKHSDLRRWDSVDGSSIGIAPLRIHCEPRRYCSCYETLAVLTVNSAHFNFSFSLVFHGAE